MIIYLHISIFYVSSQIGISQARITSITKRATIYMPPQHSINKIIRRSEPR